MPRRTAWPRDCSRLGLEPGDRIGIWSPNRYEWVVTQFATAKAGLILVNINPAYRISELEFALNKVGCKALVLAPSFKTSDYVAMLRQVAPEIAPASPASCCSARLPMLRLVILTDDAPPPGFLSYRDVDALGRTAELVTPARAAPGPAAGGRDQHPVHERDDRRCRRARRCLITTSSTTATSSRGA